MLVCVVERQEERQESRRCVIYSRKYWLNIAFTAWTPHNRLVYLQVINSGAAADDWGLMASVVINKISRCLKSLLQIDNLSASYDGATCIYVHLAWFNRKFERVSKVVTNLWRVVTTNVNRMYTYAHSHSTHIQCNAICMYGFLWVCVTIDVMRQLRDQTKKVYRWENELTHCIISDPHYIWTLTFTFSLTPSMPAVSFITRGVWYIRKSWQRFVTLILTPDINCDYDNIDYY